LHDSVRWLLGRLRVGDEVAATRPVICHGRPLVSGGPGWCYGDAGLSCALLAAAAATANTSWRQLAVRIGLRAVIAVDAARVRDPSLCHGTAGLALISWRLFRGTGDPRFKRAASVWLRRTLHFRDGSKGLAGFRTLRWAPDGGANWAAEPGLLTGAAGIALTLLTCATDSSADWARCLAL
jgi:hypothetical protein